MASTQFDTEIDEMPTLLTRTVTTSYGDIAMYSSSPRISNEM